MLVAPLRRPYPLADRIVHAAMLMNTPSPVADFICVGMFEVEEDVKIARKTISEVKTAGRRRRWYG